MELTLRRSYYLRGTNGSLFDSQLDRENFICHTIELPWNNNDTGMSCVPEGKYELLRRTSLKHGEHLELQAVKNRKYILIHPANDAIKELKGCIAPVTVLIGPGTGTQSRIALEKLFKIIFQRLDQHEVVWLTITKNT